MDEVRQIYDLDRPLVSSCLFAFAVTAADQRWMFTVLGSADPHSRVPVRTPHSEDAFDIHRLKSDTYGKHFDWKIRVAMESLFRKEKN